MIVTTVSWDSVSQGHIAWRGGLFTCCASLQLLTEGKNLGEGTEWPEQQGWGALDAMALGGIPGVSEEWRQFSFEQPVQLFLRVLEYPPCLWKHVKDPDL